GCPGAARHFRLTEGGEIGYYHFLKTIFAAAVMISKKSQAGCKELSAREAEVLGLLAQGLLIKAIAGQLGINFVTARTYVRRIYRKLNVHSRAQAVAKFARQGLPQA